MFEKLFGDFVELGVGLLVTAALLSGLVLTMSLNRQFHEKQLESQIVASDIKEHRKNMFYNNTTVYQQDVVSMILRYKGERKVVVKLDNGNIHEWSLTEKASDYKVSAVSTLLPKDSLYNSNLIYGPNLREVIGYEFVEVKVGGNP